MTRAALGEVAIFHPIFKCSVGVAFVRKFGWMSCTKCSQVGASLRRSHSLLWSGDHFPLKNNWIDWSLICSAPPSTQYWWVNLLDVSPPHTKNDAKLLQWQDLIATTHLCTMWPFESLLASFGWSSNYLFSTSCPKVSSTPSWTLGTCREHFYLNTLPPTLWTLAHFQNIYLLSMPTGGASWMFLPHGCSERFLNTLVKYLPKRFSMNWSFREHFPYSSDVFKHASNRCWLTWSCRIIHVMCMSQVAYRFQAVLCPDPLWTTGSVIAQTHAPTRTVWPLLAFQVWKCGTKRKFQLSHLRNSKRKKQMKQLTSLGGL